MNLKKKVDRIVSWVILGKPPKAEKPSIEKVSDATLWVKGNGLAQRGVIIMTSHEPALTAHEADEIALRRKLLRDPVVPAAMRRERCKIKFLEVIDDYGGD